MSLNPEQYISDSEDDIPIVSENLYDSPRVNISNSGEHIFSNEVELIFCHDIKPNVCDLELKEFELLEGRSDKTMLTIKEECFYHSNVSSSNKEKSFTSKILESRHPNDDNKISGINKRKGEGLPYSTN